MTGNNSPEKMTINGWTFRIKQPSGDNDQVKVLLLLHGHLGNEKAMWILTNPLPESYIMLAPRAPVQTGEEQYSWHEIGPQWPGIEKYQELTEKLLSRVDHWIEENDLDVDQYDVMGFSQGAVMAYALAILHPERIGKIAALAGFIPQTWQSELDQKSLSGKSFFIAHGTQDEMIPIKKGRQAAAWIEKHKADVTFCEAEIGHKLSANCFKGLGEFFH